MHLSGQYLVQARQEEIEAELLRCEFMRKASPPCLAIEHIDDITRLVTVESAVDHSIKLQYLFRFNSKASEPNRLVIDWQGTDPRSATPKGHHDIQFEQQKNGTLVKHETAILTTLNGKLIASNQEILDHIVTSYFQTLTSHFNNRTRDSKMNKKLPEFDDVLNEAKNPVEELEVEAEEAAVRGFLGGPQAWALMALAIVIILLLVFY